MLAYNIMSLPAASNPKPVLDALAVILFQLQQAVQGAALSGDPATADKRALGPMAEAWRAARGQLGLTGQWATLEATRAALAALEARGGASTAPAELGMSADMDFDMGAWDPAHGACTVCGAMGQRNGDGSCGACGSR